MEEMTTRLQTVCQAKGLVRFAPDEIVELLTDGETADWIAAQLLPEGVQDTELVALLEEIAAVVLPPAGADTVSTDPASGDGGTMDSASDALLDLTRMDPGVLPPGVDPAQLQQLLASPRGELLSDFAAFCQERGVDAKAQEEGMEARLRQLHDEWLETPRERCGGKKPSAVLEGGALLPRKVETYRREEPKIQRNDPCPCGSGKKYKKCCGMAA